MNKSKPAVTKTCAVCHLQKPLSAFLIIAGAQLYGNICASCRSETHAHPPRDKETEESSRSDSGKKIDTKTKVVSEKDKREQRKELEEEYYDEREESEKRALEKTEKKTQQADLQTKHRKDFLEKRTFLRSEEKPHTDIDATVQQEALEKTVNTAAPFIDTGFAGKVKFVSGESIRRFATWVGESSALGKALAQHQKSSATQPSPEKPAADTVAEDVKNKWGPKSR